MTTTLPSVDPDVGDHHPAPVSMALITTTTVKDDSSRHTQSQRATTPIYHCRRSATTTPSVDNADGHPPARRRGQLLQLPRIDANMPSRLFFLTIQTNSIYFFTPPVSMATSPATANPHPVLW